MIKNIKIIKFFNKEYEGPKGRMIIMSFTGSLCFALLLAIAVNAAEAAGNIGLGIELWKMFLYIFIAVIAITCKIKTLNQATLMAEETVQKVRVRLIGKLRHTELQFIEKQQKGEIYAGIIQDTELISQTTPNIVNAFETAAVCIAIFIYMSTISFIGFAFALTSTIAIYAIFFSQYFKLKKEMMRARKKEGEFLDLINDTLSGFKEIRINTRKNNALFSDIKDLSKKMEHIQLDAELKFDKNLILMIVLFLMQLAVIVFIVPVFSNAYGDTIAELVASLVFATGLLGMALSGMSINVQASVAAERLEKLEAAIDNSAVKNASGKIKPVKHFKKITFDSVFFQYAGKENEILFTTGPLNLDIKQGETLFIVGGNGSGKSTLLKLLTGLYYPLEGGRIMIDGTVLNNKNYQAYRELFSIIFTDFHLFQKLYGLESVKEQDVKNMIKEMNLSRKTDYVAGKFTNTNLSTGQKKRLAYIAAILEDKPVYVFDEWAADQDPEFRKYFYEHFLKDLKAMDKTIIAVTHDDKYFDKADRVIKMEEGQITGQDK